MTDDAKKKKIEATINQPTLTGDKVDVEKKIWKKPVLNMLPMDEDVTTKNRLFVETTTLGPPSGPVS